MAPQWPYAIAALLFAAGMWLLLPRGVDRGRSVGAGLCAAGLGLLTLLVHCGMVVTRSGYSLNVSWAPALAESQGVGADLIFLSLAFVTIASAVATVTFRRPVYCAIWFALCLMGVAGLLLYQGAQFLGVATLVVYAGAILVTILFVLMLAQPAGDAYYDRLSWEALLSSCAAAVLVGLMTMTTATALQQGGNQDPAGTPAILQAQTTDQVAAARETDILNPEHVAVLGRELFSKHLIAIEVAGTLLLVALVAAVSIAYQSAAERSLSPSNTISATEGRAHG
jgi:NADH-quinone oxidoreductase subunit J